MTGTIDSRELHAIGDAIRAALLDVKDRGEIVSAASITVPVCERLPHIDPRVIALAIADAMELDAPPVETFADFKRRMSLQ